MENWLKSVGTFLGAMIIWDCIRIFIQAWVNKKFIAREFKKLNKAVEDVEEAIEEENSA